MSFPETRRARHVFAFSFNRHPRPAAGVRNRAATEIDEFLFLMHFSEPRAAATAADYVREARGDRTLRIASAIP